MRRIPVAASRSYEITIGAPLADCGGAIRAVTGSSRAAVVTDSNVAPLYLDRVLASLRAAGMEAVVFTLPAGEASKCAAQYLKLLDFLVEQQLTRSDAIVALGGGVVGDLAGFAAATYLRGVPLVQLPTTLLAMVDSSVGGKTAIDLPGGKNLCGAFYQPWAVLIDCAVLDTLPASEFSSGCAEVIKYGFLRDPEILRLLRLGAKEHLEEIVERCVTIKRDIVERDERDNGERQLLNLGHTAGHAVEQHSNFTLSHGACVAIGMGIVTRAAIAHGDCAPEVGAALEPLLEQYALPSRPPYPLQTLTDLLRADKKRKGAAITLVVPERIGQCRLKKLPLEQLQDYLAAGF